jgi:hypothetical protein
MLPTNILELSPSSSCMFTSTRIDR